MNFMNGLSDVVLKQDLPSSDKVFMMINWELYFAHLNSLRTEVFWERFRKHIFLQKMVESKKLMVPSQSTAKSFQMNGKVGMFGQS
jgi:hypothetical protein